MVIKQGNKIAHCPLPKRNSVKVCIDKGILNSGKNMN